MKKLKLILFAWLPIFAWMIFSFHNGNGYLKVMKLMHRNFAWYLIIWNTIGQMVFNAMNMFVFHLNEIFGVIFSAIFIFLIFIGIGQICHDKKYRVLLIYAGIFLFVTWLMPSFWLRGRYYLPLLPVFCIFIIKGLETMRRNVREKLLLAFILVSLIGIFIDAKQIWHENIAYLKNRKYPANFKYHYYHECQEFFKTHNEKFKVKKPEVFLWIKTQEEK